MAEGLARAFVSWRPKGDGVECDPVELRHAAVVVGTVRPPDGWKVMVLGCDGAASAVNSDGSFYMEVTPDEECEVWARRWDADGTITEGERLTLVPDATSDNVVQLELP